MNILTNSINIYLRFLKATLFIENLGDVASVTRACAITNYNFSYRSTALEEAVNAIKGIIYVFAKKVSD